MDLEYFDRHWKKNRVPIEESKTHWDFRAKDFHKNKSQKMVKEVISFFKEKGMLRQGDEVIDIGCGAGKYAIELSKTAKNVTALDFSSKMLEFARENAEREGAANVEFLEIPWEDIDPKVLGWKKRFDFAAAIMSPAINSKENLDKLLDISKGYCFMSGHMDRHERIMEQIEKEVLQRESQEIEYGRNIYCSFNILWQYGLHPELTYYDMKRENIKPLEEAFSHYCHQLERKKEMSNEEKEAVRKYLVKISEDGVVKDLFESKTVWLYWKNK